jgi:hypothetical protein
MYVFFYPIPVVTNVVGHLASFVPARFKLGTCWHKNNQMPNNIGTELAKCPTTLTKTGRGFEPGTY